MSAMENSDGRPDPLPMTGHPQMVALFENGVTVATFACEYACAISRSTNPGGTSVSLFSNSTSPEDSRMPRLTVAVKPQFFSLRKRTIFPASASS